VLLWCWLHRQLCYDRVVRWERECLLWLWWGVVRASPSSHTGSHNAGSHNAGAHAAGAHASGAHTADRGTVLLGQHLRELCRGLVVQHRCECLHKLWRSLVQHGTSSHSGSYHFGADAPDAACAHPSPGVHCVQEPLLGFLC